MWSTFNWSHKAVLVLFRWVNVKRVVDLPQEKSCVCIEVSARSCGETTLKHYTLNKCYEGMKGHETIFTAFHNLAESSLQQWKGKWFTVSGSEILIYDLCFSLLKTTNDWAVHRRPAIWCIFFESKNFTIVKKNRSWTKPVLFM